ncbi:MAG TPA: nucleotide exchange factor GrpE [Candidatus Saccharimonadales bacterium]|jgi:molecular chaperone GrpE|nr:nucleotide exchange factor GrpE [Candidatus Saccharimonadales bacterium]
MSKSNGQAEVHTEEQEQTASTPGPEILPAEAPVSPAASDVGEGAADAAAPPSAAGELLKLRAERDNLFDRLARLQAEFDNYRKRASKENADFRDYALADSAKMLVPVMDSFTLALKNAGANPEDFKKGVELIHKQFQEVLQKLNVQRVPSQGEPFDPRYHEAIEMVDSNEVADNHVLEELQAGYRMKDRLLRPAMVRVARNTKKDSGE